MRHLPRFRQAYRALARLADRESWGRDQIEAFQLDRINRVWRHAAEHVPYYRALRRRGRCPTRFVDLHEFRETLPVLKRAAVLDRPHDFLSRRRRRGHWTRTGGSTGTPMKCYWSNAAHREMLQAKYRFLDMWGLDIFARTAFLWGASRSFAPGVAGLLARWRQPLEDWIRNRIRLSSYHLGPHDLREYLRRIANFRPAVLYGYATAVDLLAREAETYGFTGDSLQLITLTGEHVPPDVTQRVERVFKAPAVIEYGSIECGNIAGQWTDRTLRVREDVVYVETLPRDDERFELVVTVLNNPSFPLLRYAIGDVTDAAVERPASGFAILKNVAGRCNDFVVSRSGRYLHASRFDAFFKYECPRVRRFRMRQRLDGQVYVAVEIDDAFDEFPATALEMKLRHIVDGHPVKLEVARSIEQMASGKHRFILSDLAAAPSTAGARAETAGASDAAATERHLAGTRPRRSGTDRGNGVASGRPTNTPYAKAARLRQLLRRPQLDFAMEAHNGLSARIVEEAGFEAIWASGLSISAALGVRDSNEASWTQVLETLEFMSDSTRIPILVDGDTGYGNFNNMRRLVRKLEQRAIGGVCIEDKLFPKTNSFIRGTAQPLAEIGEFCGRIQAGKDTQESDDFVIIARIEAFIAGWGLDEAMKRAEAYHAAGADAILIHSSQRTAEQVISFKQEWADRGPVVIVPTKYYATPTDVFREHEFSLVIWANHLMRTCITAMQRTAQQIYEEQSLLAVEDRIAPIAEVFRLQRATELAEAEKRYLPPSSDSAGVVFPNIPSPPSMESTRD